MAPWAPLRPCVPGCPERVPRGVRFCPRHAATALVRRREADRTRYRTDWVRRFEVSREWIRARQAYREAHPLCSVPDCGIPTEAVDHVVGLRQGGAPLDWANLAAYCRRHHAAKGARAGELFGKAP